MKTLIWIDEKDSVQFTIIADLNVSDLIELAESLQKKKGKQLRKPCKKTTFFCIYIVGSQNLHCNSEGGVLYEEKVFPVRNPAGPYAEPYNSRSFYGLCRKPEPVFQRNHSLLRCGLPR